MKTEEIKKIIENSKKIPEYNVISFDYASLYPTNMNSINMDASDIFNEIFRQRKIEQRKKKIDNILNS